MVEYAISAVRYNEDRTICRVRAHEVRPGSVGPPFEITRDRLLRALAQGRRFVAIRANGGNRYSAPIPVQLVEVDGIGYLRCDPKVWPLDDLEGLETF
jgi:hypothetical protein